MLLYYYVFYLKYLFTSCQLHLLINCQWVSRCNVCQFLLMPDISMHSFIEEDIYVTTCNFCLDGCMDGLVAVLRPFQQYFSHKDDGRVSMKGTVQ